MNALPRPVAPPVGTALRYSALYGDAAMPPPFKPNQKLLFAGDSITDCGRRNEPHAPYGNGYVHLVRALLLARYPELNLEILNRGIGGNTVRDLAGRWDRDVLAEAPDWLVVKIGINDVWRQVAGRESEAVPLDEYRTTYGSLLRRAREAGDGRLAGLILMEPYVIAPRAGAGAQAITLEEAKRRYPALRAQNIVTGPEFDGVMVHFRAVMDTYIAAVRDLAAEHGAVLVPTQGAFDEAMRHQPAGFWAADRVHPGAPGHAVIARAFLRATGYGDV